MRYKVGETYDNEVMVGMVMTMTLSAEDMMVT